MFMFANEGLRHFCYWVHYNVICRSPDTILLVPSPVLYVDWVIMVFYHAAFRFLLMAYMFFSSFTLQWHHNGRDGVSDHQPHDCLLKRLFRRRSKKHQSSASLAFVWGIHRWPMNSPHKGSVTRKMFPFNYVILKYRFLHLCLFQCRVQIPINVIFHLL